MSAPLSLEEALDIAAEIDNADDPVTLTEHGREVIEVLRDHVLAARKELDALPEMLRVGVGGARPPKAAKSDEELRAALAIVKEMGRYSGQTVYRKVGDAFVFARWATQEEDDAYIAVYQTGLAAGWGMMAERDAALAEVERLTGERDAAVAAVERMNADHANLRDALTYVAASCDREIEVGGVWLRAARRGPPSGESRWLQMQAVVKAAKREREVRAAWLASIPTGACASPPTQALLDAEAATRAALAEIDGDDHE